MIWTAVFILCQAMLVMPDDIITYKTFDGSDQNEKTWERAKRACSDSNSLLALLDTKEKISAVKDSLSSGPYWVGLMYDSAKKEFIWSSGEVADRSFLNGLYDGNENSLVKSGKTCFLLTRESKPFKKERCGKKYGFICQTTGQAGDNSAVITNSSTNSTANSVNETQAISASRVSVTLTEFEATIKNSSAAGNTAVLVNAASPFSAIVVQTVGSVSAPYPTTQRLEPTSSTLSGPAMPSQAISATKTPLLKESVGKPSWESHSFSKRTGQYLRASTYKGFFVKTREDTYSAKSVVQVKESGQSMRTVSDREMLPRTSTPAINTVAERTAENVETVSKEMSKSLSAEKTTITMRSSEVDSRSRMMSTSTVTAAYTSMNEKPMERVSETLLPGPTTPTTPRKQKEKSIVQEMLRRMKTLNVEDPVSISGATNIWDDCLDFLNKRKRDENDSVGAFLCTRGLEDFAIEYAGHHLNSTTRNIWIDNHKMTLKLSLVTKEDENGFIFEEGGISVHLPSKIFQDQDKIVYTVVYHDLHKSLRKLGGAENDRTLTPNTHIVGSAISPTEGRNLLENVTLLFQHIKDINANRRGKCAFWNFSISQWSTFGCSVVESNASSTVCTCNHLTNFAVLIQTRKTKVSKVDRHVLELMTYIGLGLSIIGEAVTLASYFIAYSVAMSLRDQQEQQLKIRRNLVATLALAQIMFLSGIGAIEVEVVCISMAALIHYFYLVAFCWMLVEGVYLYIKVIRVYHADIKMSYCNYFAFGSPAVVVASTLCLTKLVFGEMKSYVNSSVCWLSFENYLIWTFIGPVILIELTNAVILFLVLKEMASMQRIQTAELDTFRQSVKACVVLFPLLGITWLFGLLSLLDSGVTVQYIFTILNSAQGFLIFIFHCVRNSQIRAACGRRLEKWLESKSYSAGGGKSSAHESSGARARGQEHSLGIGMIEMVKRTTKITPVDAPSSRK